MKEIVLLVNGPGELYTWVRPVLRELREQAPSLRVVLGLLPCPFATGYERGIAETLPLDALASVAQILEFMAGGRKPAAFVGSSGLVLGLGGDVAFPGRIAQRLGYVAWRYSFEPYWKNSLERLFVHDEKTLASALRVGAKAENIGNLVADALTLEPNGQREANSVLFLPGSRSFQVVHLLGVAAAVAERLPGASFHISRSSLVDQATWALALSGEKSKPFEGLTLRQEGRYAYTPNGTRLEVHHEQDRYALMKRCAIAITSPGTNTLELGIAGIPSVVCMPLQKMELIPTESVLRYLEWLPVVGKPLKRAVVLAYLRRFKYISLPNMLSDEAVFTELRGAVTVQMVADAAKALLENQTERARIEARLVATMPRAGAAKRLVQKILERVGV
ncbi:MAG: hypothetical protein ACK41E_11240 [Deinococcales bacterium]